MPVSSDVPCPLQVLHWCFAPQLSVHVELSAVLPDTPHAVITHW